MFNRPSYVVFGLLATGLLAACGGGAVQEPNVVEPVVSEGTSAPSSTEPEEAVTAAEPATETEEPVEKIDKIDCSRIDDPEYRKQVEASGIDPDSIDCGEDDTGD